MTGFPKSDGILFRSWRLLSWPTRIGGILNSSKYVIHNAASCSVSRCNCGSVHVAFGATVVNLAAETFLEVAEMYAAHAHAIKVEMQFAQKKKWGVFGLVEKEEPASFN